MKFIIGLGNPGFVGYSLFEGNRIGYASPNPSVIWADNGTDAGWCVKDSWCSINGQNYQYFGGQGLKLCHPYNIVRHNAFFNNSGTPLSLGTYADLVARGRFNRIYSNTFAHNGWYQKIPTTDMKYATIISGLRHAF